MNSNLAQAVEKVQGGDKNAFAVLYEEFAKPVYFHTQIDDISHLEGLVNLLSLNLSGTLINDISSLTKLTNLMTLNLYSTYIDKDDYEELRAVLPNCSILTLTK